jgi:hypothetical protein
MCVPNNKRIERRIMRKHAAIILTFAILLFALVVVPAFAQGPPELQRIIFIHPAKPPKPPGGGGENGYFKLITGGVKWKTFPVPIEVNPDNSGLDPSAVLSNITISAEEWDDGAYSGWGGVSQNLFQVNTTFSTKTYGDLAWTSDKLDGANTLVWGNYPTGGVIAVTILWYNPATKSIVEFDIVFDTDYKWSTTGASDAMDLQNIATHEIGHGAGLGDVYQDAAYKETMYGYSIWGETSKRDLYTGDKQGITKLYG